MMQPLIRNLEIDSSLGMLLVVMAHSFMNFGFIGRVVSAQSLPRHQVEAARLDGARDSTIRRLIELPQQRAAITSAALLVALYSATSYGLVLLVGGGLETLETQIAMAALQRLDLVTASQLALAQTGLTLLFFVIALRLGSNPGVLNRVGNSLLKTTWINQLLGLTLTALVTLGLGVVLALSLNASNLFENYVNLGSRGSRSLLNISVVEAATNSLRNLFVVILIAVPVALIVAGRKRQSLLVLLPLGISPVVIGLFALVGSGYLPREISSSWILLPLVQALFAIPLAYQILRPARAGFDSALIDAAKLDGANRSQSLRYIELPLLAKPIYLALAFSGLSSLGEFGAASFLAFGSGETLPLVMFRLASRPGQENFGMAMAAATIYILITVCIVGLSSRSTDTESQVHQGVGR